uniref:B-type allatostatin n=1 Tax=Megabalanus volcano TaxID=266495 RepID=A0A2D2CNM0_MEGVO|nr:B-type allatostatin [Megabalanus volcano]
MWTRCLLLSWACLLLLLTVRAGSAEAEQPQAVTAGKRDWDALHGNWGKRQPSEVIDDPEDDRELMREVAGDLVLSGYEPEDKRKWNSFTGSWGKRAKWNNFSGSWGKRSKWNSMGPSWGKRAKWDNFGGSWGKRGKWENFGGSWGKRKNWDNFNGAWGKRKGWDSFSGGWGKRAAWNNFGGSWGKRDASLPTLQEASDPLETFIKNNYKLLQARVPASSGQTQARKRKDWTQLNGMWGKRSPAKELLLV